MSELTLYDGIDSWPEEMKRILYALDTKIGEYGLEEGIKVVGQLKDKNIILSLPDEEVSENVAKVDKGILDLKYYVKLVEEGKELLVLKENCIERFWLDYDPKPVMLSKSNEKIIHNVTVVDAGLSVKDFLEQGINLSIPIILKDGKNEPVLIRSSSTVKKETYLSEEKFSWYSKK